MKTEGQGRRARTNKDETPLGTHVSPVVDDLCVSFVTCFSVVTPFRLDGLRPHLDPSELSSTVTTRLCESSAYHVNLWILLGVGVGWGGVGGRDGGGWGGGEGWVGATRSCESSSVVCAFSQSFLVVIENSEFVFGPLSTTVRSTPSFPLANRAGTQKLNRVFFLGSRTPSVMSVGPGT